MDNEVLQWMNKTVLLFLIWEGLGHTRINIIIIFHIEGFKINSDQYYCLFLYGRIHIMLQPK